MSRDQLLKVRKQVKAKKPDFKQQNFGKKAKIEDKWRRPRGLQSKMRHGFKGYPIMVSKGWRSPRLVRGLHGKGLEAIIVHNVAELKGLQKGQGIIIASTVGNKKRLEIVEKAESLGVVFLNIKADKFKAGIAKLKEDRQKEKAEKSEKKKKTVEDSLKKAEKKEKEKDKEKSTDAQKDTEESKAVEKKEKDEILIHKE